MEPWELAFCKWAAANQRARKRTQEEMASHLAGTTVNWIDLRHLRARKNFQQWYHRYRAKILQRLDDARETFESQNVPQAIEAHRWALGQAKEANDYKAVGTLAEPAIKALYKQIGEEQQKPLVVLNLGTNAGSLDEPPINVEYEQLPTPEDHVEP